MKVLINKAYNHFCEFAVNYERLAFPFENYLKLNFNEPRKLIRVRRTAICLGDIQTFAEGES